jgi:hypothetical protein
LTLRLKPLKAFVTTIAAPASSAPAPIHDVSDDGDDDDSMSDDSSDDDSDHPDRPAEEKPWSLPPYPRRSISIPCYTPAVDGASTYFPPPQTPYQRSSSVSHSEGSLPPDSEDDDDDYHISMTGGRRSSTGRMQTPAKADSDFDWDADDSEGDSETMWESPGPRSPSASAPVLAEVAVKQEPRDLDTWDDFGADVRLASDVKVESIDNWSWHSGYADPGRIWYTPEDDEHIKQEELDLDPLSSSFDSFRDPVPGPSSPLSPLISSTPFFNFSQSESSPVSSRRGTDTWRDSDTPELESEFDNGAQFSTVRPRSKTAPSLFSFFSSTTPFMVPASPPPETAKPREPPTIVTQTLASLIETMSMNSPTSTSPPFSFQPPCISPQDTRCDGWSSDTVIVHTCLPCTPTITATHIEGTFTLISYCSLY